MTSLTLFDPEISGRLCLALLHSLWQVGLAAIVAGALGRMLCRGSVERSYVVHVAALVVSVVGVAGTFVWLGGGAPAGVTGQVRGIEAKRQAGVGDGVRSDAVRDDSITNAQIGEAASLLGMGRERAKPQAAGRISIEWETIAPWMAGVYAVGVGVMLLRLVAGVAAAERLRRLAWPLSSGPAAEALRRLVSRWKVRIVPALARAEHIVVPTLVGLMKPTILLPTSALTGLTLGELELILAHELAHVRRRDMWVNLLQRLAEVALFFNPALWYLSRRIGVLREFCCDEFACRARTAPAASVRVDYAATLLRVVELAHPSAARLSGVATLAASGRSPSDLRRRIARLLGEPMREPLGISRGGLLFAGAVVLALTVAPSWLRSQSPTATPAAYPPPKTEADDAVAAARERTFGLKLVPRVSIRQRIKSGPVAGMTKSPELSLKKMFEACGKEFDVTVRPGDTNAALTWNMGQLLIQTISGDAPHTFSLNRYWDGADGWIGEDSMQGRHVYRYPSLKKLMEDQASIHALYFPQFAAAGGRLTWGGPSVEMELPNCRPELTRYKLLGNETIDDEECQVYEGPQRMERLWIAKSTGLVKAASRNFMHDPVANYYTELTREAAGRTFADENEYREWSDLQTAEVKEKMGAHWSAAHWLGSEPGHLAVFSHYREIVPGVRWPMHCERIGAIPEGKGSYKYYRNAIDVTEVTTKFVMEKTAGGALPHEGDQVTDRRFAPDEPEFTYTWKGSTAESDVEGARRAKLEAKRQAEAATRKVNEASIESVDDAIKVLTDGPKTDPTMIWARAIKYLVDHKDEGLPAAIKQLDGETRDHAISKLAFALRAMGDPRGVPALIRALPRTLLPSRSDYGLQLEEDITLLRFMQRNDQTGKERGDAKAWFDYGRAFREVVSALHRLTKKDFGEMELNFVQNDGTDTERRLKRQLFQAKAKQWAEWWESEGHALVDDAAYAKVHLTELPQPGGSLPSGDGVQLINRGTGFHVGSALESPKWCFIDLDTRRRASWPSESPAVQEIGVDSPELLAWASREGFDLMGFTTTPPGETKPIYCLKPVGMSVWKITPDEHRDMEEFLVARKPYPLTQPVELLMPPRGLAPPYDMKYGGNAFLFVTAEGTAGLIRITAEVTEIGGEGEVWTPDSPFKSYGMLRGVRFDLATMDKDAR